MPGQRPLTRRTQLGLTGRLLASAGVAALAASMLAAPASAAPQPAVDAGVDGATVEVAARAYLAAYPGMSSAAARSAVEQETRRRALLDDVKDARTYGGAWFDAPSGILHVALTTKAARSEAARLGGQMGIRLQTHQVARTLAELEAQASALRTGTDAFSRLADDQVGIDVATNQVTVAVSAGARMSTAAPAGVRLVPASGGPAQLDVCTARNNCADSLRSGLLISGPPGTCSIGFTARDPNTNRRFVLTSGHCRGAVVNQTWSTGGTAIGPFTDAIDSGVVDAGAIQVNNATYAADTIGRIYLHAAANRFVPVNGAIDAMSDMVVGDRVCLSANITQPTGANNCGVLGSLSDANKRGLARVDGYDACQGDSGGGWYATVGASRIAYGLHSRSENGCQVTPARSWFSALPQFWTGLDYDTN